MPNPISIVGTIATAPRTIQTQSGVPLCTFRVASSERRFDRESKTWSDGETNWFSVTAFRGLAQHASESFQKGDRVIVSGRLRVRNWERDEKSGTSVEIEADALGHDLRWGVSSFTKRVGTESSDDAEPSGAQSRWANEHSSGGGAVHAAPGPTASHPSDEGSAGGDGFIPAAA